MNERSRGHKNGAIWEAGTRPVEVIIGTADEKSDIMQIRWGPPNTAWYSKFGADRIVLTRTFF